VRRADNLTTFMCRLSKNLGASTSWSPKGLPRPVMGLLDLFIVGKYHRHCTLKTEDVNYDLVFKVCDNYYNFAGINGELCSCDSVLGFDTV
jgi:hypothetical protein